MTFLIKSTPENRKLIFNAIKAKILKHLEELEREESGELKKTFSELTGLLLKGGKGLPVGTIREWKGKKFIKVAPGKWKPKYDSETRGAKLAISALKKKIALCEDEREMMQLVLENRDRFSDKDGNPLPFVQQLSEFISQTQQKKNSAGSGGGDDGYPEKNYPEYKGKGQEAVDFIVKQQGGQVRGAFNRHEIGDIDVVWGEVTDAEKHTGYGLSHIIDKHGMDAARVIGEVIEYGKVVNPTQGRISIQLGYWKVALKQQFNGNKKIWIVTSFKNEDRGQTTTPSPQSDYTKGTNSETSTTSIPQSSEKSSAEKVKDLTNKYAPESVETIKNEFFPNLDARNVKQLLDIVKKNRETGETVKFKYNELHFGKDKYIESGLGIETWDFDYRNPRFTFPAIGGYISFSEIKEDTFNETLLRHIKSDVEFYEKYKEDAFAVKLHHTFKFVKLLQSYDSISDFWKDFENHKSFRSKKNSVPLTKSIVWLQNYLSKSGQKEESAIEVLRKRLEKERRA